MKLACVGQDRIDIADAVKCLTGHMKEPRSGRMTEVKRLGLHLTKNKRCVLSYPRQMSDVSLQVHVDSDGPEDLLGRKSTSDGQTKQTLAETHVMLANACWLRYHAERLSTTP